LKKPKGTHGCSLWKVIISVWENFLQHVELVAGLGSRIRFWHDNWCDDTLLKTRFPVLFGCLSNKNAFIDSCLTRPVVGEGLV
jgi:hypothetical protein